MTTQWTATKPAKKVDLYEYQACGPVTNTTSLSDVGKAVTFGTKKLMSQMSFGLFDGSQPKITLQLPSSILSETLTGKHKDIADDENTTETKFTMKLLSGPPSIVLRAQAQMNKSRVTLNLNHTELLVIDNKDRPLLILNYTQISKWSIVREDCIFAIEYTKSHYNGEFKYLKFRTNNKNDGYLLDRVVSNLEHKVGTLVVHKGLAKDLEGALAMFKPVEEAAKEKSGSDKGVDREVCGSPLKAVYSAPPSPSGMTVHSGERSPPVRIA